MMFSMVIPLRFPLKSKIGCRRHVVKFMGFVWGLGCDGRWGNWLGIDVLDSEQLFDRKRLLVVK